MGKSIFNKSLRAGEEAEIFVKKFLIEKYNNISKIDKIEGKFAGYDLIVEFSQGVHKLLIEVKLDKRAADTNNVFVEYEQLWKSSNYLKKTGVNATSADVWVFVICNTLHKNGTPELVDVAILSVDTLKHLIEAEQYLRVVDNSRNYGDDANLSKGYLFRKSCLLDNSIIKYTNVEYK